MKLSDILGPDQIILELRATERFEAIDEVLGILVSTGKINEADYKEISLAVKQNEQSEGTGVGFGLAFPHAYTDVTASPIMALGRSKDGINFVSRDQQPVRLLCLALFPVQDKKKYFKILAAFARHLVDAHFLANLSKAPDQESILRLLIGRLGCNYFPPPFLDIPGLLSPDQIILNMRATNIGEAIDELMDKLVAARKIKASDRDAIADSVKEREQRGFTSEAFIAAPRCFCGLVPDPICAFGISRNGIEIKCAGKQIHAQVTWVMIVLRPADGFDQLANNILFSLWGACFKSKHLRETIDQCTEAGLAYNLLSEHIILKAAILYGVAPGA